MEKTTPETWMSEEIQTTVMFKGVKLVNQVNLL
jgi:hypothetical protein